jgi:MFS family permease
MPLMNPTQHAARATAGFFTSRAGLFVVLAFLLATQNTYASTLAASLFLSHVGASAIPLYYILFAAASIPCSAFLSRVIDRVPRQVLLKYMLGIFVAISLAMSGLLGLGDHWYYVVYIGISICEQLLYSLYYVLFADYFSVTDAKRATARVAIGMAFGGLAGGAGVAFVTSFAGPRFALVMTPVLVVVVFGYFGWLARLHQPLENIEPAAEESITESLRVVPRLLRRYPMVALLAAAMFLNVFLQCVSEYLAFTIYTAHFPSVDALATFLGFVHAGLNLLGFVIVVAFTDRQLTRLGVAVMNRVYPALNTLSFGVLTLSTSLPAGILANIAYDPFVHSIDVPVVTMNYNAIRYRLVGRVRVFVDGFVYPLGLAVAGVALEIFQRGLSLRSIALIGFVGSLLLLAVHWNIGKHYVRGLLDMLRDGAVDFENVDRSIRLPPETIAEIRTMLGGDQRTAYAGLQMVLCCNHEFTAAEIAPALAAIPTPQARTIVEHLARTATPARRNTFEQLGLSDAPAVRQLALEASAQIGTQPHPDHRSLLTDPDQGVQSVAAAMILIADPTDAAALAVLGQRLEPNSALGAINVLRLRNDEATAGILSSIGHHADASVRAAALFAVKSLDVHDAKTLTWAREASSDESAAVREGAFAILARAVPPHELEAVLDTAWTDPAFRVRQAVVNVLQSRGDEVLPAVYSRLWHGREDAQLAAIETVGRIQGTSAEQVLLKMLEATVFPSIALHRKFAQLFSPERPGWQAMAFAIDNSARRNLGLVMHALEALGHQRTLKLVRTTLNVSDERARANAIESLASLPRRQFVGPLAPLFEDNDPPQKRGDFERTQALQMLQTAQSSNDEGMRAAAAIAWHVETGDVPPDVLKDPSPLVVETARSLMQPGADCRPYQQEAVMNRLAFLHSVPLFAKTTLDDLIVIDRSLTCETYLRGESIVTEGESGDRLCIVYRGEVAVRKRMPQGERELARLSAGDFFGEMSLFDDEPRSATVSAIDEVEVLILNRDRFHSLVQQRPSVLMELCTTLVGRLRKAAS